MNHLGPPKNKRLEHECVNKIGNTNFISVISINNPFAAGG